MSLVEGLFLLGAAFGITALAAALLLRWMSGPAKAARDNRSNAAEN